MNIIIESSTDLQKEHELLLLKYAEASCAIQRLQEQIDWLKKQLFGKKSERFVKDDGQLYLPGFEELVPQSLPEEEKVKIPAHEKRKAKSTPINTISYPDDLPVETQVLDLSDEEKIDEKTGAPLVCIGEEISRKLAKKPASYFVKETIRKKYAVVGSPDEGILTPSLPDSIITRCAVDESILADILVKKFKIS